MSVKECGCESCSVCLPLPECSECGGAMSEGLSDEAFHRDGRVLLIRHIPSIICKQCGQFYLLDVETVEMLEAQFERFLSREAALCEVSTFEEGASDA